MYDMNTANTDEQSIQPTFYPIRLGTFLWHFIKRQKTAFILLIFFQSAWAIYQTILPYVFKIFTDYLLNYEGDYSDIWQYLTFPIAFGAGIWIYTEISFRCYELIHAKTIPVFQNAIRTSMFSYVHGHSYSYFTEHFAGSLAKKINKMPESSTRIIQTAITLFIPASLALLIAIGIFFTMHPLFAAILFLWISVHIGISLINVRKYNHIEHNHSTSKDNLIDTITDSLLNHITVRIYARKEHELDHLSGYQNDEQRKHYKLLKYLLNIHLIQGIVCFIMIGICMFSLLIYCYSHQIITISEFIYIFYTSWGITIMIWMAGKQLPSFVNHIGVAKHAISIMKAQHGVGDTPNAKPLTITNGTIHFDTVTFHYKRNNNLFDNKTVTLNAKQKIGLVGFSGSGKTTFINLIMRLFDVDGGRILIDDQDIRTVTIESLRKHIAFIPQSPYLFNRTLVDNIRYGRLNASDAEVIEAAKKAYCHEFITQLDHGYDTIIGKHNLKLSDGQRHRIAIARAYLKNAPILILDEINHRLDSYSERVIHESLPPLMENKTTLVITRRLSTLSEMDRILVFKDGHMIEDGTHEELLAFHGHYTLMWHMQSGGMLPKQEIVTSPS